MVSEALGTATVRRVEWLTLALGAAGMAWAGLHWGPRGTAGVALGTAIAWINFRWLKGSVRAFGQTAVANSDAQTVRIPVRAYLKFFGRFALLLGAAYVILTRTWFPAASVLVGLFASPAAVIAGLVYELVWSGMRHGVGGSS